MLATTCEPSRTGAQKDLPWMFHIKNICSVYSCLQIEHTHRVLGSCQFGAIRVRACSHAACEKGL